MADKKYALFLEKIIQETKRNTITWCYLDSNKELYEAMNWIDVQYNSDGLFGRQKVVYPDFDTENSFYTKIDGTYVVILVRDNTPAIIYVIPNTYKKKVVLPPEEYGALSTRLLNLVQEGFPDADRFIADFLDMDK